MPFCDFLPQIQIHVTNLKLTWKDCLGIYVSLYFGSGESLKKRILELYAGTGLCVAKNNHNMQMRVLKK